MFDPKDTTSLLADVFEPVLLGTTANDEPLRPLWDEPDPGPEPAVECVDVSKWYGTFQALDGIDLRIETGQVVSIIGRSGSGKSTLVRCLNRLEQHTSGVIRVLGQEVNDDRFVLRDLRERIGMVFQEFNLFGHLSVEANVAIGPRRVLGRTADESHELALAALAQVDMTRHAHKRPTQLSGGEQQRVAIARMLAMQPDIVLLDEPTASIDPELTKGVMEIVKAIAATDVTVVAVTHELSFVRAIADRVVFIEDGRIVEEGTAQHMLTSPDQPRLQQFLEDTRILTGV